MRPSGENVSSSSVARPAASASPPVLLRHVLLQATRAATAGGRGPGRRLRHAPDRPLGGLLAQHRRPHGSPARPARDAAPSAVPRASGGKGARAVRLRPLRNLRVHPGLSLRHRHARRLGVVVRVRTGSRASRAGRQALCCPGETTPLAAQAGYPRPPCRLDAASARFAAETSTSGPQAEMFSATVTPTTTVPSGPILYGGADPFAALSPIRRAAPRAARARPRPGCATRRCSRSICCTRSCGTRWRRSPPRDDRLRASLNAAMERMFVATVWRNLVKRRTERRPDDTTPAMMVGLTDRRWSWRRVLSRRLFYNRIQLPEPWPELYRRDWTTPLLPSNARHRLLRAF